MSETIERAAKALHDKMEHLDPGPEASVWEALSERECEFYRLAVRAVLANLHEPDSEMGALAKALRAQCRRGGPQLLWEHTSPNARAAWLDQARFVRAVLEREGFRIVSASDDAIMDGKCSRSAE